MQSQKVFRDINTEPAYLLATEVCLRGVSFIFASKYTTTCWKYYAIQESHTQNRADVKEKKKKKQRADWNVSFSVFASIWDSVAVPTQMCL